jgi:serine phosphatase RsbU (regulator of sigma subunit)/anti-sigma regulatory factor (Ser/Thr protein kinase)
MFKNVLKKELIVAAKMANLKGIRDFIEEIGHAHKYSEKTLNSFKLVIDEVVTNIIRHGYRDIPDGRITIRAIVRRFSLTIVVIDQGVTFDPRQAKNPDLRKYIDIGKKGGLGILMMRKLMDDIQYSLTPEGNELRLTRRREQVAATRLALAWDNLSMQARFTAIASAVIIVLGVVAVFTYNINSEIEVKAEELRNAAERNNYFARVIGRNWATRDNDDLYIFAISEALYDNTPEMIAEAFFVDNDSLVVANVDPKMLRQRFPGKYRRPLLAVAEDSIENVAVHSYINSDSILIYDLSTLVIAGDTTRIGTAHIWVTEEYIANRQFTSNIRGYIYIGIALLLVIGLVYFLIQRIINPFSQLAEWVRRVGQGKVDQDEFDIDTTDELGEIAQAFNELTTKFRESQVSLIEQQRLQKELQVAQEIQHMLLPQDFPQVKGYELASYYQAAKEVGGDLFDFVNVDEDTIGICVADVSGKGVPGSMIMTMIRTALRLEAKGNKNAADVLARVNRFVTDDMRRGMFVTIFYIILDSRNRVVSYASAGHNPMILYRASTEQTYYLNPVGFPVGIALPDISLFDQTVENDRINLRSDDILVIITDGVTEAMNSTRDLFGDERLLEVIRANGHLPVQDFVRNCRDSILQFTKGFQQNDDITIVAVKEKLSASEVRFDVQKRLFQMVDDQGVAVEEACEKLKVSPFTYYKYRPIVDKFGLEGLARRMQKKDDIELRHLSVEVQAKIFDIISSNVEVNERDISMLLSSEKYGKLTIPPNIIAEELKRLKLDTLAKREKFLRKRGDKKGFKTPGTPLLTLDGQIIKDYQGSDTFSPIFTPKKRVFTNLEDKEPAEMDPVDNQGITATAANPAETVTGDATTTIDNGRQQQTESTQADGDAGERTIDVSPAEERVLSDADSAIPAKELPRPAAATGEEEIPADEVQSGEAVVTETDNAISLNAATESLPPVEGPEPDAADQKEKTVLDDALAADETTTARKRIKTYSELDDQAQSRYDDFFQQEEDRLGELLHLVQKDSDVSRIKQLLEVLTADYGQQRHYKKLAQMFKQAHEVVELSLSENGNLAAKQQLRRQCLNLISKKNILADDVAKVKVLNEIGFIKRKMAEIEPGKTRSRLRRHHNALSGNDMSS